MTINNTLPSDVIHDVWADQNVNAVIQADVAKHGVSLLRRVDTASSASVLQIAEWIGSTMLDIDEELSGPPVMDIKRDVNKENKSKRPAYFTADNFPLHTDLSYVDNPPRFMIMHCVHPDPDGGGVSLIADCNNAFRRLPPAHQERLASPMFRFSYPPNCRLGESSMLPVYDVRSGKTVFRFRLDGMTYSSEDESAIQAFQQALHDNVIMLFMEKGDLLVLDNHRMVHGRTNFNGTVRHMRRAYAAEKQGRMNGRGG